MRYRYFPAAVLAAGLLFYTLFSGFAAQAADKKGELTQKQTETRQEYEAAQSALAALQAQQAQTESEIQSLSGQAAELAGQIEAVTAAVQQAQTELDARLSDAEAARAARDAKQAEYKARLAVCKEQLRAMQRLDGGGALWLLTQAKSLYQLLTFATTLDQIVNKDEDTCQQLENEHAELEQQRAELEQAKADLEATQADLETQKTALDGKTNELAQNISQTDANISAADAEIEANKAALIEANKAVDKAAAELDAALNAANQAYGNASIQCSLDFGRPLATYKYVSCYFGGNGHRGTDYAAPGGTEIYAVSGGVVTAAAYHWSWGYYVQVYHGKDDNGNTYSTLYAHMNSAPVVSVGQPVEKGEVLGYVGSTGNSTGNHLHLEMKVNGVLTSVTNYIS